MSPSAECVAPDGHRWTCTRAVAELPVASLLWLPALGVPATKYRAFAEALAARGLSVVVHEWRGNDSSSLRPSRRLDWGYRTLVESDIPASAALARQHAPDKPLLIGGHSIGGQLAALTLARGAIEARGLVLVATGVPDARVYPPAQRLLIAGFSRLIPLLTGVAGHFPGDRLRWAGREAAQLMREWAGTVRLGHYDQVGLGEDLEQRLGRVVVPRIGLRMTDDWLVPRASLDRLIAKLGPGAEHREEFDAARLGATADHFRWMRRPEVLADAIAGWTQKTDLRAN